MKQIALLFGPRGAGKTTFAKRYRDDHEDVVLFMRDEYLLKMYHTLYPKLEGSLHFAMETLIGDVEKELREKQDAKILLELPLGDSKSRYEFVLHLREKGADRIVCWYFNTSRDQCREWFFKKDAKEVGGMNILDFMADYSESVWNSAAIRNEGYDSFYYVNPLKENSLERTFV